MTTAPSTIARAPNRTSARADVASATARVIPWRTMITLAVHGALEVTSAKTNRMTTRPSTTP